MSSPKSDRLRKLETEYNDLKQWLDLKLVPKKDLALHEAELKALEAKIFDEKKRLQTIKDSPDAEEYSIPRRNAGAKAGYNDGGLNEEMEMDGGGDEGLTDAGLDMENDSYEGGSSSSFDLYESFDDQNTESEEDEDPFSDRNRWKRGILEEQDNSQW